MRNIRESILRITTEDYRREAVGFEGRAAHGSVVGAEIRGWRRPGVIEAGWKMSGILPGIAKSFDIWNSREAEQPPLENPVP